MKLFGVCGRLRVIAAISGMAMISPSQAWADSAVAGEFLVPAAPDSSEVSSAALLPDMHWALSEASGLDFSQTAQEPPDVYGPPVPASAPAMTDREERHASFGEEVGAVKWEVGAILAYMTVTQLIVTKETESFHFQDEGWFGKDTKALGMDKLTHAFNTYMFADFLQHRIEKRTGSKGAVTAALLASGLQLYSELYDAHKVTSGFSVQDVVFNTAGAGFSVLRNSVPGLRDKLDFRLMLMPNSDFYTFKGKRHYAQQRYLFALTLAGFDRFKDSPLRFVELHTGYYGKNFTGEDIRAGKTPQRKLFFGVGLNLKELFFRAPKSEAGKMAGSTLDYLQIPYTAAYGRAGF